MAAATALTVGAAPASADFPVEAHSQSTGNHCNPCNIQIYGESMIIAGGVPVLACEDALNMELYEDGRGHVTSYVNAGHLGFPCLTQKCNGVGEPAAETEWPVRIEEDAPSQEEIAIGFCIEPRSNPNGSGNHCTAEGDLANTGSHQYEISIAHTCPSGSQIVGSWAIANTPVEIEHPDPTPPVEVHDEGGTHCDPCEIEAHGESQLLHPILGPISSCLDTLAAEIYEDGSGHVTELVSADHGELTCLTEACNGVGEPASETEWPFQIVESEPGEESLGVEICLDGALNPDDNLFHCDLSVDLVNLGDHRYELSTSQPCPGGLTLAGTWEIEGTPIEVEHPLP